MSSGNETSKTASPEQMRHQHILVVNGLPHFLDIVHDLLQDERYNVTTTNFVPGTFAQLRQRIPHCC